MCRQAIDAMEFCRKNIKSYALESAVDGVSEMHHEEPEAHSQKLSLIHI